MQEFEHNILEQYDRNIGSTRKTRGAVLCYDTCEENGVYLLKELVAAEGRIPMLCELYEHLKAQGYEKLDELISNKEGNYVTIADDGSKYILKHWFLARECDVKKPAEILGATAALAKLHISMRKELEHFPGTAEPLPGEYARHNRELKKVRAFIRAQTAKGTFEYEFLRCFDHMYHWANIAEEMLQNSHYEELYQKSMVQCCMVHGEYNYHNILMERGVSGEQQIILTNFDKVKRNVQVEDLYYFLRKIMEKYGWKSRLADNMINAYSAIKPLSDEEMEYMKIRFLYPEKFWKIANSYYHSNKAWISVKNVQKLEMTICQTKEKERFMKSMFSFG